MEKLVGSKGMLDAVRRMAPVKLTIGLLYRELDTAKNDHGVTIDRALFESVISTLGAGRRGSGGEGQRR